MGAKLEVVVIARRPSRVPGWEGAKAMVIVQVAEAASVEVQVVVDWKSPVRVKDRGREVVPVFFRVMV